MDAIGIQIRRRIMGVKMCQRETRHGLPETQRRETVKKSISCRSLKLTIDFKSIVLYHSCMKLDTRLFDLLFRTHYFIW